MAHCALRTTFTAVAGDHSFPSRSSAGAKRCVLGGIASPDVARDAIGDVKIAAYHRKMNAEICKHAGILRALAGKEESQTLCACLEKGLVPEIDASRVSDPEASGVGQFRLDAGEAVGEIRDGRRDDSQS